MAPQVNSTLYNGCGQIHAPATLPNYVHIHLTNKALQTACNLRNLVCLFPYAMQQWAFHFLITIRSQYGRGICHTVSPTKTNGVTVWLSPEVWLRVLKWTKHQLPLYHNLPMLNRFFHACLTFSSDYAILQQENDNQDAYQNKYR